MTTPIVQLLDDVGRAIQRQIIDRNGRIDHTVDDAKELDLYPPSLYLPYSLGGIPYYTAIRTFHCQIQIDPEVALEQWRQAFDEYKQRQYGQVLSRLRPIVEPLKLKGIPGVGVDVELAQYLFIAGMHRNAGKVQGGCVTLRWGSGRASIDANGIESNFNRFALRQRPINVYEALGMRIGYSRSASPRVVALYNLLHKRARFVHAEAVYALCSMATFSGPEAEAALCRHFDLMPKEGALDEGLNDLIKFNQQLG